MRKASPLFDGILLLDDGSTDGTYDMADDSKLIIKVQKRRDCFNDLQNRNILMDLSSFVDFELAVFLDVDEAFDDRFCDLRRYLDDKETDAYIIPCVNLWDDENAYNAEYPNSANGICLRYRIFRNIGHAQIYSDRGKLHFLPLPTVGRCRIADSLLVKHYGLLSESRRNAKYDFYKSEDTEKSQSSYEHFKASPRLNEVSGITSEELKKLNNLFKPKL